MIQYITRVGNLVLWRMGNYHYEIENRATGEKKTLLDTSCEDAMEQIENLVRVLGR